MSTRERPHPFVKWAGGKSQLLGEIARRLPSRTTGYHEPFVGSGAVYYHLWRSGRRSGARHLYDTNADLISTYEHVRDYVDPLIAELGPLQRAHSKDQPEVFYERRAEYNASETGTLRKAALFIYLNKTCFNGLYRVNKSGGYNVPFGRHADPAILDEENLRATSEALQGVQLHNESYKGVLHRARKGQLVYFDPPYDPLNDTAYFTSYTKEDFGPDDQSELAQVFATLCRRGVHVVLSNAYTPRIRALYEALGIEGLHIDAVLAKRSINRDGEKRGAIQEHLIWFEP